MSLYQQNIIESLEPSKSISEDVKCKRRCINLRKVSDHRRAFWPAFGVSRISEVLYMSTMGAGMIMLGDETIK
jgi:hypothetical protein